MNKNMTSGEGGAVVTNNDRLYQRAFAAHDLGYARNEAGRLVFDDPGLCLWGWGTRLDEMRGAVLRVQLRKLPDIAAAMRGSKYRIRRALEQMGGVGLRRVLDPQGDTGAFLLTIYRDAEAAISVSRRLQELGIRTFPQGISNIVMTAWGLHLYYNIASLTGRTSADRGGFPWTHPANEGLGGEYGKGACPYADSLFERTIVLPVPSCLTERDENDVIRAFEIALEEQR
jgi:8-amino-3,8-dideoxy-alpha-D-manno-octulosonate transaminase